MWHRVIETPGDRGPSRDHIDVEARFPAGFISIDCFLQNRAPICCLCFDGIGARHLGLTLDAGARSPGQNPSLGKVSIDRQYKRFSSTDEFFCTVGI